MLEENCLNMKIVFASHTHMQSPFVVGSHHLAKNLARLGHEVLHIATPVSPFHLLRTSQVDMKKRFARAKMQGEEVENRLLEYIPFSLLPAKVSLIGNCAINPHLVTTVPNLPGVLRKLNFTHVDMVLLDQRAFVGLWRYIDAKKWIYRPTDLYSETKKTLFLEKRREKCILEKVDGLVATSQPVLDQAMDLSRREIPNIVLRNGVDINHFSEPKVIPVEYADIPGPRVVYAGALDERFNWKLVESLASNMPAFNFILIGPYNNKVGNLPKNIHLLGARAYELLPAYFQHADVGLLPLSDHPENKGRSPMKFYEYIAAGLPIVATETPEFRKRDVQGVYLCSDENAFVFSIESAMGSGKSIIANDALLEEVSWVNIANSLLRFAEEI